MKIIVLKGKHVTNYYRASTPEEIEESSRKIMQHHLQMGFYDEHWGNDTSLKESVRRELENPSGKAWKFIRSRSFEGHEYESVSLEDVQ